MWFKKGVRGGLENLKLASTIRWIIKPMYSRFDSNWLKIGNLYKNKLLKVVWTKARFKLVKIVKFVQNEIIESGSRRAIFKLIKIGKFYKTKKPMGGLVNLKGRLGVWLDFQV